MRWTWMLLVVMLAGCAEDAAPEAETDPETTVATEPTRLSFGVEGPELTDAFSGRFEFTDNDQFAGDLQRTFGMDPDNLHRHEASHLVPDDGLFEMVITATAQAAGGDIDIGVDGSAVRSTRCDCPFGSENTLTVYGFPGDLDILIQYDEISSGPDDPNIAAQGVPYEIEVVARPLLERVPPAMPLAIELQVNDTLVFEGHDSVVTVHDGADIVVAVLEPGTTEFTAATAGEHVLLARQDGVAFALVAPVAEARFLAVDGVQGVESFGAGQPMATTFEAGAGFIEMFACGLAGDLTVDPDFRVTDPDGEAWSSSSSSGPQPLGWGSCTGTWRGHPELPQGEWQLTLEETAGSGAELLWFTAHYVR